MSKDVKLGKAQLFKIIQSGGFLGKALGNVMGNLGKTGIKKIKKVDSFLL